jgi:hypothetical protein
VDVGTAVVIGAAVGGVTAVAGGSAVAYLQLRAAERHQRNEWRALVYVEALAALNRQGQIIRRTSPVFGPGREPPPAITDEVAELVQARLGAHASTAMRQLLDRWGNVQSRFFSLAWDLDDAKKKRNAVTLEAQMTGVSFREAAGGRTSHDIWMDLDSVRVELVGDDGAGATGILGAIEAQVRKELGYKD